MRLLSLFCFFIIVNGFGCKDQSGHTTRSTASVASPVFQADKLNGLTFVAPPEPFPSDPMLEVTAVGASWIAVVPYAFTRMGVPNVRFNETGSHWWGERPEGVKETIRQAHKAGIKVMLKPQVYVPGGWTGALDFNNDADWESWESTYSYYILYFAELAQTEQADLFCIGTEFNRAITKRPAFWHDLIQKIKEKYKGKSSPRTE
jgi:hypothetical protein